MFYRRVCNDARKLQAFVLMLGVRSSLRRFTSGSDVSRHLPGCRRSALTSQWLFQLYLALECDIWIGTRNSNWNRLIDEMR